MLFCCAEVSPAIVQNDYPFSFKRKGIKGNFLFNDSLTPFLAANPQGRSNICIVI